MNLDQLNMAPANLTLQTAYAALDSMQDSPPALQVMGAAVLFHQLCTEALLDPSEMLDKARRLSRHAEDNYSNELHGLRAYIQNEIKK
jgi:hypothetical protein